MSQAREIAKIFVEHCQKHNFGISIRNEVISITTKFEKGNRDTYTQIENQAMSLLHFLKMVRPGSIWGSTSDGIGGYIAIENGNFVLNKSGCSKRVLNAIEKML